MTSFMKLVFMVITIQLIHSIDYLDHVSCTDTANFGLFGITNDTIYSLNGNTRIVMQDDGNVVLSKRVNTSSNWAIKWHTNISSNYTPTPNRPSLAIQKDGNLVLYLTPTGGSGWQSNTWTNPDKSYHFVVSDNGCAYLLDNTQSIHYSFPIYDCNTSTSHPTYAILPTLYPTNNPTTADPTTSVPTNNPITINPTTSAPTNNPITLNPTNNPITYRPTTTNCDHYFPETIEITLDQQIGLKNVTIRDVMEISFDLRLNESCPSDYCHLLHIGSIWQQRLPLINIPSNTGGLQVVFSDITDPNHNYHITDSYLAAALIDGSYHSLYFKWSASERIFIFDNITYKNEMSGTYDFTQYINNKYPLYVVDKWSPYIIKGHIKNLCIKSTISTVTPTDNPTISPTDQPSISPTDPSKTPSISPITSQPTLPTTAQPTLSPSYGHWTKWYGSNNYQYNYTLSTVDGYHITKICTAFSLMVDRIEVDFNDGMHSGPSPPGTGGSYCYDLNDYVNNTDYECFTSLRAGVGAAVDYLQFYTSFGGNTTQWGSTGGIAYNINSTHAGECITKIEVRTTDSWLVQIRLFFHPLVTRSPSVITIMPTNNPSNIPTITPSNNPSKIPTNIPSKINTELTTLNASVSTPNPSDLATISTNIISEAMTDDKEQSVMIFGIIGGVLLLIVLIILAVVILKNKGSKSKESIEMANNIDIGMHESPNNKDNEDSFDKLYDVLMSSTSNENNNASNNSNYVTEGKDENINNDNDMYNEMYTHSIMTPNEHVTRTAEGDQDDNNEMITETQTNGDNGDV